MGTRGIGSGDLTHLTVADVVAGEAVKAGEEGYSSFDLCQLFSSRLEV